MIVLDTHAWLWWRDDPDRLSELARKVISTAGTLGVPTISCWELATLQRKGRLRFGLDVDSWITAALGHEAVRVLPLDVEVAVIGGMLPREFPGDPVDRIIYATARARGATLITKDRAIRAFDPRLTLW